MIQKTPKNKFSLILGLWLLSQVFLLGQNTAPTALFKILESLENEYDLRFSYQPEDVNPYILQLDWSSMDLEESLITIQSQTGLWITKIDQRYFTLTKTRPKAKNYCAQIFDAASKLPLHGATVKITGTNYLTTTDIDGSFLIEREQLNGAVQVTYLGQKPLIITPESLERGICPSFYSEGDLTTLETVKIGRYFTSGIVQRHQGNFSINTRAFGLLPGQTQNDALWFAQALPGVESTNETVSTMNIRGGTNDENNISWEGIRMYQYGHFFGLISAFNPMLSTELDLYKAGGPVHFRNYVSGAMNIHSSDELPDGSQFHYSLNALDTQFSTELRASESLGIRLAGRTSYNRWIPTPVYNSYFGRMFQDTEITNNQSDAAYDQVNFEEQFYFFDFGGKINYYINESTHIKMAFMAIENHFEFTEALANIEKINKLEQKSNVAGVFVHHQWNESQKTSAKFSLNQYHLQALNQDIFSNQTLKQDNEVLDIDAYITHDLYLGQNQFSVTYDFNEIGVRNKQQVNVPLFFATKKEVIRSHMAHLNWRFRSDNNRLKLNLAGRASHYPKWNQTLIEPILMAEYKMGRHQFLNGSIEQRHQTIGQRVDLQSDFLGIEKRRWSLADDQNSPMRRGKQFSLGWGYNRADMMLNIQGYYKEVKSLSAQSQLFQNQFQFSQAIGAYSIKGVEISGQKSIGPLDFWGSYSWSKNDYNFNAFSPSVFPNNGDIRHQIKWAINTTLHKIKYSFGGHWHSGLPYTETTGTLSSDYFRGFIPDFDRPNERRLNSYLRLDFSAQYQWWTPNKTHFQINLGLINLLNQNNTLARRFRADLDSIDEPQINTINTYGLGFTPNASLSISW